MLPLFVNLVCMLLIACSCSITLDGSQRMALEPQDACSLVWHSQSKLKEAEDEFIF